MEGDNNSPTYLQNASSVSSSSTPAFPPFNPIPTPTPLNPAPHTSTSNPYYGHLSSLSSFSRPSSCSGYQSASIDYESYRHPNAHSQLSASQERAYQSHPYNRSNSTNSGGYYYQYRDHSNSEPAIDRRDQVSKPSYAAPSNFTSSQPVSKAIQVAQAGGTTKSRFGQSLAAIIARNIGEYPSVPPAPASPSDTYQLNLSNGKLTPNAIRMEFVLVEQKVAVLDHVTLGLLRQVAYIKERSELAENFLIERIQELNEELEELKLKKPSWESNVGKGDGSERDTELDDDSAVESDHLDDPETLSKSALNSTPIKMLANMIYTRFLGVAKLGQKSDLPDYVEDENEIPFVRGTEIRQARFQWDKPWKEPGNHKNIVRLAGFAKTHGAGYLSTAKPFLEIINEADLEKRFRLKYNALQKTWRGTTRKSAPTEGGLTMSARDNRARGKLEVRIRKRNLLDPESEWRKPKYDTAFVFQLMSDDENTKDPITGKTVATSFTSRPPNYRSDILNTLYDGVDEVHDLRVSNQYTKRIKGPTVEKPPPATRTLVGRARRWMVDPTWLQSNLEMDVETRIADNGRLWGDATNPEELVEKTKKLKADKEIRKRQKSDNTSKKNRKEKGKEREVNREPDEEDFDDIY